MIDKSYWRNQMAWYFRNIMLVFTIFNIWRGVSREGILLTLALTILNQWLYDNIKKSWYEKKEAQDAKH